MIKNLFLPILAVMAFIVLVGYYSKNSSQINLRKYFNLATPAPAAKDIKVGNSVVEIEIADTLDKRTKGLSGRNSLDQKSGMLFIFDSKNILPVFWMKGMLFPLDFIWVVGGKIVKIDKNVPNPAPGVADADLQTYASDVPVDYVLEVNGGFVDKNSIKVGDLVDLTNLGK